MEKESHVKSQNMRLEHPSSGDHENESNSFKWSLLHAFYLRQGFKHRGVYVSLTKENRKFLPLLSKTLSIQRMESKQTSLIYPK